MIDVWITHSVHGYGDTLAITMDIEDCFVMCYDVNTLVEHLLATAGGCVLTRFGEVVLFKLDGFERINAISTDELIQLLYTGYVELQFFSEDEYQEITENCPELQEIQHFIH